MTVIDTLKEPTATSGDRLQEYPRTLVDLGSSADGPTVLCVAGLHGNEPAGVLALKRISNRLARLEGRFRGRLVGLTGNRQALAAGHRFLETDLNRAWPRGPELALAADPTIELGELSELARTIEKVREAAGTGMFCLDLHTTSGLGPAFAVLNDTLPNRVFARAFPVPVVLGLEEELAGTLAGYLSDLGVRVVGFESGQHQDPVSVDRAEDAIWIALGAAGLLDRGQPEIEHARRDLAKLSARLPKLVEVRYRHALSISDSFRIAPGLEGFQTVPMGSELGSDRRGPVRAPADGLLLMPLYQDLGEDAFFITRRVRPMWLRLSTTMRHLRLERFLHWLPGVRRHPDMANTFVVDRHRARWLGVEVFHLLGFRRLERDDEHLTMTRRLWDAY